MREERIGKGRGGKKRKGRGGNVYAPKFLDVQAPSNF